MKKEKDPIRLRERSLANGVKSLYLDIYKDGQRTYEFLKMYINPGNDALTKAKNKATYEAARVIQSKRLIDLQCGKAEIVQNKEKNLSFIDYYTNFYQNRSDITESYRRNAMFVLDYWEEAVGDLKLSQITVDTLRKYLSHLRASASKHYVKTRLVDNGSRRMRTDEIEKRITELRQKGYGYKRIGSELGIDSNEIYKITKRMKNRSEDLHMGEGTIKRYFGYVNVVLNYAEKNRLIINPARYLEPAEKPKDPDSSRSYLTLEEISKMIDTPCDYETIKKAFLFACFTGFRMSDLKTLVWQDISGNTITKKQIKTNTNVFVPLSENALRWLPERGNKKDLVFPNWPDQNTISRSIAKWVKTAGIEKYVTFHVSRHTFATLALTYGADLYTVSKLLGHHNIETTQIYAKIVDQKKVEAVNLIPKI